jgi:hypothetical protein
MPVGFLSSMPVTYSQHVTTPGHLWISLCCDTSLAQMIGGKGHKNLPSWDKRGFILVRSHVSFFTQWSEKAVDTFIIRTRFTLIRLYILDDNG